MQNVRTALGIIVAVLIFAFKMAQLHNTQSTSVFETRAQMEADQQRQQQNQLQSQQSMRNAQNQQIARAQHDYQMQHGGVANDYQSGNGVYLDTATAAGTARPAKPQATPAPGFVDFSDKGIGLATSGDFKAALIPLKKAHKLKPKDGDVCYWLFKCYENTETTHSRRSPSYLMAVQTKKLLAGSSQADQAEEFMESVGDSGGAGPAAASGPSSTISGHFHGQGVRQGYIGMGGTVDMDIDFSGPPDHMVAQVSSSWGRETYVGSMQDGAFQFTAFMGSTNEGQGSLSLTDNALSGSFRQSVSGQEITLTATKVGN